MSKPISKIEKSQMLHKLGYKVHRCHGLDITIETPDGKLYIIAAATGTCSCQYNGLCSHLLGIYGLMLDTSNALDCKALDAKDSGGDWLTLTARASRLSDRAHEVLLALERRRIAAAA